jgi:hypothetical protein
VPARGACLPHPGKSVHPGGGITAEDVLALIPNQVREGKTIDYKRDIIGEAPLQRLAADA